jgi:hypothetical protein
VAAGVALARVDLTTPDGITEKASLTVRANRAVAKLGSVTIGDRTDVSKVEKSGRRTWLITFEDGTSWSALRKGGCSSCGGNRG